MQKMGGEDGRQYHSDTEATDKTAFSGPLSGPLMKSGPLNKRGGKKSARFNIPGETASAAASHNGSEKSNEDYVEITLDFSEDSVAVHSVKTAGGGANGEDNDLALLAKGLEKRSSFGSSAVRNASMKIRQVSQELKRLASLSRRPQKRYDRSKSGAVHALMGLKFISKTDGGSSGWAAVEGRFDKLTESTDGLLPRALFFECIGMNKESKEFAGELFDALVRRRHITRNSITKEELKEFWEQISDQSFDSRLQTFFDMVDKDADGRITEEEVREIISLSASANKLSNIQKQADEYAALIMEELDPDNLGFIMIENLEMLLLQGPAIPIRGGESKALSQMLSQKLKTTNNHVISRTYRDTKYFLQDNWQRFWVLALWIGIMAGLFAYKYVQYKNRAAYEVMGVCVCLAKGAAETLKFNMALILLPVCRNTITWLRNKTRLGVAVPFDDNLNFHKIIAIGIAIGVGIHAMAHLTCDFPRLLHADEEKYELMEPFFGEEQPPNYWWFVKGVEGITGIIMVVLMAIAFTLASPWLRRGRVNLPKFLKKLTGFNAFWYSHHLFVIVYALLIVHGIKLYLTHDWYKKTTWMYLSVPIILYAGERLIRAFRSSIKPVKIRKVAVYPGNVLALHMSKPQGFKYKSGQYMFVNCAAVSPFEWHPFSITSAPDDDYLSVHIRTLGDWTGRLKAVFSEVCQPPDTGKSGLLRADCIQGENNPNFPKVLIDGPYGAPAQDYKKYDVVLLVGLGIGATPMISIVKDIVNNIKAKEEEANAIESGTQTSGISSNNTSPLKKKSPGPSSSSNFKTTRAYFYWVTREQGSFDWFKGVMNEVAEPDNSGVIEMHNYCTSVYEEGDARSALITMLQSINHAKNGVDVVSGTRVKSHFATQTVKTILMAVASDLVQFLNASPTPFHAVEEAKRQLKSAKYEQISEREDWSLQAGKTYFFTRNYSTILAFAIGKKYVAGNGCYIIGAHTDSPCLKLKPISKVGKGGFLQVGVQTYGGGLWHTWFDRDLTVAGRMIIKEGKDDSVSYSHRLVRIEEPIMRIPTLAIHLDRTVNEGFKLNTHSHLVPVLATSIKAELNKPVTENGAGDGGLPKDGKKSTEKHHSILLELLATQAGCKPDEICDFELQACDTQPSIIAGAMKEFIFSGRLDNLCMSFCSLKALIDSTSSENSLDEETGVRMVALFDHEEVGSNSAQGAGSPVMFDALSRITSSFSSDSKLLKIAIQRSFIVSADMAHALHPNYMDKHEENHQPKMHCGLVIKHNANQRYATNAVTSFLFREIAHKHNLPIQDFVVRNDMPCGSTIGPILASGIGIRTVDVGGPQLSMHSIREMCAVDDVKHAYEHFKAFFEDFSTLDAKITVDN